MPEIHSWSKLSRNFTDGLIIGNGASIAIDPSFSYSSLFENAAENGLITKNIRKIFEHLKTEDFELVLRMLWHAFHINKALGVEDNATSIAYGELRNALVKAVRDIHVTYDEVIDRLPRVASFMRQFSTVISLNYDFLVYWAMLAGNSKWDQIWFKDCFIDAEFDSNWEKYKKPHGSADGSTLVFYPHGNMVLATDLYGEEIKLATRESKNLLDTIIGKWESGDFTPLFVSEGTSSQKLQAIGRSGYLSSVYNTVLPKLGNKIVIFGWSMSENDQHIFDSVAKSNIHAVAVSVQSGRADLVDHCAEIKRKFKLATEDKKLQIFFFDAESKGCWANP